MSVALQAAPEEQPLCSAPSSTRPRGLQLPELSPSRLSSVVCSRGVNCHDFLASWRKTCRIQSPRI